MTLYVFNSALNASRSTCFGFSPGLCWRGNITYFRSERVCIAVGSYASSITTSPSRLFSSAFSASNSLIRSRSRWNPFLITPERHPAYFIILLHHFWESLLLFQPLMQKIVIDLVSDITPFVSNSTDDSLFLQPEQTRSSICGC